MAFVGETCSSEKTVDGRRGCVTGCLPVGGEEGKLSGGAFEGKPSEDIGLQYVKAEGGQKMSDSF